MAPEDPAARAAAANDSAPDSLEEVQGRRAGFVTRGIAFVIDFFCVLAAFPLIMWGIGLTVAVLNFRAPEYPQVAAVVASCLQLGIIFFYFVGPWAITGRTIGQGVLGLRVVGRSKVRINLLQAVVRWLVLFLTLFIIGPVWLALSGKRLALHDRASRTQVIYERSPRRTHVHVDRPAGRMEGTRPLEGSTPADQPHKEPSDA